MAIHCRLIIDERREATVMLEHGSWLARLAAMGVAIGFVCPIAVAEPVRRDHIAVELVSEATSVQPGRPLPVAVRLAPDPHWHTYWRNPGDTGLPTEIRWTLPEGSEASPVHWPFPQRIEVGHLVNYGYDGEVLLLTDIHPPPNLETGRPFQVVADVNWLVCEEVCIPGEARLSLELPVRSAPTPADSRWQGHFEETRQQLPLVRPDWRAVFEVAHGWLNLELDAQEPLFDGATALTWFPIDEDVVAYAADQALEVAAQTLVLRQAQNEYFQQAPEQLGGVLVVKTADRMQAYQFSASPGVVGALAPGVAPTLAMVSTGSVMLAALAGGLILNLMPCVFPVLSIKALSLARSAHGERRKRQLHGLAYTAGVLAAFLIIAVVLMLLRAAGHQLGWGFQLQSAAFVAAMAYLMFLLGLNLSGFFELSPGLSGAGQSLVERPGYGGSFFTGVLAVVVASPCTAPFMGTAIGYALTQSLPVALGVFAALGLGLALPFLLLGFVPALARWLPRPGPWMLRFKQLLAFPLYLTAVWLLWVLGRQTGVDGLALALCGLVLLALAIWLWKQLVGWVGRGLAVLSLALACALPLLPRPDSSLPAALASAETSWEPYSPARLQALRSEARPVLLNVTADWCITCLVNERVALETSTVQDRLRGLGVASLKGDWTRRDPELTALLAQFGRSGVPLYVLYPPAVGAAPVVLPQILTPGQVLAALEALNGG